MQFFFFFFLSFLFVYCFAPRNRKISLLKNSQLFFHRNCKNKENKIAAYTKHTHKRIQIHNHCHRMHCWLCRNNKRIHLIKLYRNSNATVTISSALLLLPWISSTRINEHDYRNHCRIYEFQVEKIEIYSVLFD